MGKGGMGWSGLTHINADVLEMLAKSRFLSIVHIFVRCRFFFPYVLLLYFFIFFQDVKC